ncbi:hypothetical protein ASF18_13565 [Methylobacterium sp. Leaf89]|jgi:hypothetical protein|nr:hypothetical protein ASF18_13565 [Methylobacterium sp. Leaf89]
MDETALRLRAFFDLHREWPETGQDPAAHTRRSAYRAKAYACRMLMRRTAPQDVGRGDDLSRACPQRLWHGFTNDGRTSSSTVVRF